MPQPPHYLFELTFQPLRWKKRRNRAHNHRLHPDFPFRFYEHRKVVETFGARFPCLDSPLLFPGCRASTWNALWDPLSESDSVMRPHHLAVATWRKETPRGKRGTNILEQSHLTTFPIGLRRTASAPTAWPYRTSVRSKSHGNTSTVLHLLRVRFCRTTMRYVQGRLVSTRT
jgi:hypothetical protein